MWPNEEWFWSLQRTLASDVLTALDPRILPEVFLVGVPRNTNGPARQITVVALGECWARAGGFAPIDVARSDSMLSDAILQSITQHPGAPAGCVFFASAPQAVGEFFVCEVLGVEEACLAAHPRLASDEVVWNELWGAARVARSLLDAAIGEILEAAADELMKPNPGRTSRTRSADDILRAAGRRFCADTAFRIDPRPESYGEGLFAACDAVSSLTYERSVAAGTMVLASKSCALLDPRLTFTDPVDLANHRRVRKLLELTSADVALHCDSSAVYGLVGANTADAESETVFDVRFVRRHQWEMRRLGRVMMGVRFGKPCLPLPVDYEAQLRERLLSAFPDMTDQRTEGLVELAKQASQAEHGALLVISARAAREARRLKAQGTPITARPLSPDMLERLARIDGAVLVDPQCQCHGIGMILDGTAKTNMGDPARGARFNSAARYVASCRTRKLPCLAVVVSEDGGVDIV